MGIHKVSKFLRFLLHHPAGTGEIPDGNSQKVSKSLLLFLGFLPCHPTGAGGIPNRNSHLEPSRSFQISFSWMGIPKVPQFPMVFLGFPCHHRAGEIPDGNSQSVQVPAAFPEVSSWILAMGFPVGAIPKCPNPCCFSWGFMWGQLRFLRKNPNIP